MLRLCYAMECMNSDMAKDTILNLRTLFIEE